MLSCLTVKNGEDSKSQSKETKQLENLNDKLEPPSPEEARSWSESFDRLMSSGGRKVFREFLRSEYSEENMLFWLACEELKKLDSAEQVEEKARLIYEDYISILSPKEINNCPLEIYMDQNVTLGLKGRIDHFVKWQI